jgi:hypothetical protein
MPGREVVLTQCSIAVSHYSVAVAQCELASILQTMRSRLGPFGAIRG